MEGIFHLKRVLSSAFRKNGAGQGRGRSLAGANEGLSSLQGAGLSGHRRQPVPSEGVVVKRGWAGRPWVPSVVRKPGALLLRVQ